MLSFVASWLTPASLFVLLNVMIGTIFLISRLSHSKSPYQRVGPDGSVPPLARAPSLLDRVKSIDLSFYKFAHPNPAELDFGQIQEPQYPAMPLHRAPSLLERVKSINFSLYKFNPSNPEIEFMQQPEPQQAQPDPPQIVRAPSLLERVKSIDFASLYRSDSVKANPETERETEFPAEPDLDSNTITDHGQVKRSKSENKVTRKKLTGKIKKSVSENSRYKQEEVEDENEEEVEKRQPETTRVERTVSIGDVDAKADDFINRFKNQLRLQRLDSIFRYKEMLKGK